MDLGHFHRHFQSFSYSKEHPPFELRKLVWCPIGSHHIPMINHELLQNPKYGSSALKFTLGANCGPIRISDKQGYVMSPHVE